MTNLQIAINPKSKEYDQSTESHLNFQRSIWPVYR